MRVPPASMNYSFFRAHKRDLTIAAVVAVVVMLGQTVVDGSMAAAIVSYRPSACKYGLFRSQCTVELKGRKTTPAVSPCGIPPPSPRCKDGKTMARFTCVKDGAGYKWESSCPPVADGKAESQVTGVQAGGSASAKSGDGWRADSTCRCYPVMGMPNWKCADGSLGGPNCMRNPAGSCAWFVNNCPRPN